VIPVQIVHPFRRKSSSVPALVLPERSDVRFSDLVLWLVRRAGGNHLPHGVPRKGEPVGVVHETVENGVGHGRVREGGVPAFDGQLA